MADSDKQYARKKQEWAEIYNSIKCENEQLKSDVRHLNSENEKMLRNMEHQKSANKSQQSQQQPIVSQGAADRELAKRLKKRESECQALWDTLKDMQGKKPGTFDAAQMMELLAVRALDTKAKRKLGI